MKEDVSFSTSISHLNILLSHRRYVPKQVCFNLMNVHVRSRKFNFRNRGIMVMRDNTSFPCMCNLIYKTNCETKMDLF